jgi:hypothetical protein
MRQEGRKHNLDTRISSASYFYSPIFFVEESRTTYICSGKRGAGGKEGRKKKLIKVLA